MAKCWQLLTWDIPLKLMRLNADNKAKAAVIEPKKDYVKPKAKMRCPKCGGKLRAVIVEGEELFDTAPFDSLAAIRLYDNWERDGVFGLALCCKACGWTGEGGCVVVEVRP